MALTEQDVRNYLIDSTREDNDGLDLHFTTEQIVDAMRRAARAYNSIPPLILKVSGEKLPDDTNIFLDGTAVQLFISEMNNLTRQDIEYSAGGVQSPIARKRIEYLKALIDFHTKLFTEAAKSYKVAKNIERAYRHYR
jgi:hypothetical protein